MAGVAPLLAGRALKSQKFVRNNELLSTMQTMMACRSCSRRTLGAFLNPIVHAQSLAPASSKSAGFVPLPRFFSVARPLQSEQVQAEPPKPFATSKPQIANEDSKPLKEKPKWLVQKEALKEKLGGTAWNPRKKLSPDTMEGIRHLHNTQPQRFTTAVLSQHFKVSPEAIRRILKSKWRPTDEEQEERLRRWDRRGEKIWSNLVELGVKPPKKWREMGVGKARTGEKPKWKSRTRNTVPVHDSINDEDIIPFVDGTTPSGRPRMEDTFVSDRLGV